MEGHAGYATRRKSKQANPSTKKTNSKICIIRSSFIRPTSYSNSTKANSTKVNSN
jgi:hypothetical protein